MSDRSEGEEQSLSDTDSSVYENPFSDHTYAMKLNHLRNLRGLVDDLTHSLTVPDVEQLVRTCGFPSLSKFLADTRLHGCHLIYATFCRRHMAFYSIFEFCLYVAQREFELMRLERNN